MVNKGKAARLIAGLFLPPSHKPERLIAGPSTLLRINHLPNCHSDIVLYPSVALAKEGNPRNMKNNPAMSGLFCLMGAGIRTAVRFCELSESSFAKASDEQVS